MNFISDSTELSEQQLKKLEALKKELEFNINELAESTKTRSFYLNGREQIRTIANIEDIEITKSKINILNQQIQQVLNPIVIQEPQIINEIVTETIPIQNKTENHTLRNILLIGGALVLFS